MPNCYYVSPGKREEGIHLIHKNFQLKINMSWGWDVAQI